jgi:hypothetical protein
VSGQTQVSCIGLDDDDRGTEALAKSSGAHGMKLHRDYPGTGSEQVGGDGPITSADVEYQVTGTNPGGFHQSIRRRIN